MVVDLRAEQDEANQAERDRLLETRVRIDELKRPAARLCKRCREAKGREPGQKIHEHGRRYHVTGPHTTHHCHADWVWERIAEIEENS